MQSAYNTPLYKTDFWMIFLQIDHCVLLRSNKKNDLYINKNIKAFFSKVANVGLWLVSPAHVQKVPSSNPGRTYRISF